MKFWGRSGIAWTWLNKVFGDSYAKAEVAAEAKPVPPPAKADPNNRMLLEKLAARTPKVTPIKSHTQAHEMARRRKQAEHQAAKVAKQHHADDRLPTIKPLREIHE